MESFSQCKHCKEQAVVYDSSSCTYVCSSCGIEQHSDIYKSHLEGTYNAPQGTIVRVGASQYSYKEKKLFDAKNQIDDVASSLGLSSQRSAEIYDMINQVTEGEFGAGNWFSILIAVCAHIVMRQNYLPLSISEIASVTGADMHEIGRMVMRVTDFLGIKLPEFDAFAAFERAIRSSNCFSRLPAGKVDQMLKQGRFLLQCCVKWFLTTGRQPMPVIAAVSMFVAEVNDVDVKIEDIAKEIYAGVTTSKMRYKELKETLIKVAQALPWGKDVTEKNLVKNAPLILRYMAIKSRQDSSNSRSSGEPVRFNLSEAVNECMNKEIEYSEDGYLMDNDSTYFSMEDRKALVSYDDMAIIKLSEDCLWKSYMEYLNGFASVDLATIEDAMSGRNKRRRVSMNLECEDQWVEGFDLDKKLSLKQILERNFGFDACPPSFVAGMEARRRRREKIKSAKQRISEIVQPLTSCLSENKAVSSHRQLKTRKEWQQEREKSNIDNEDCIIELLILHGVNEEEIELGHYNTLLDLHIFNSLGSKLNAI